MGLEVNADKTKYMVMSRDQNAGRSHSIKTDNSSFARVEELKYLGTTLKDQNSIREGTYCTSIGSTCFGHYFVHHQQLATIMLITTLVVSFCKDGRGSVNVKLWFLVVCVRCEVLCSLVVADSLFLLILIVVIVCVWRL